ncbi:MAG: hypothetical protein AAF593_00185 [Planctomycetota bacterium]
MPSAPPIPRDPPSAEATPYNDAVDDGPPAFGNSRSLFTQPTLMTSNGATLNFPTPFIVPDVIATPSDRVRVYFSSDHGFGTGAGIFAATAPGLFGPWTLTGKLIAEEAGAQSPETPVAMWDEANQQVILYYHVYVGATHQRTLYRTTADGLTNLSASAVAIDDTYDLKLNVSQHSGYATFARIGGRIAALSLYGGGDDGMEVLSWHPTGLGRFQMDVRPMIRMQQHVIGDLTRNMTFLGNSLFRWGGSWWRAARVEDHGGFEGASTTVHSRGWAKFSDDLRRVVGYVERSSVGTSPFCWNNRWYAFGVEQVTAGPTVERGVTLVEALP